MKHPEHVDHERVPGKLRTQQAARPDVDAIACCGTDAAAEGDPQNDHVPCGAFSRCHGPGLTQTCPSQCSKPGCGTGRDSGRRVRPGGELPERFPSDLPTACNRR